MQYRAHWGIGRDYVINQNKTRDIRAATLSTDSANSKSNWPAIIKVRTYAIKETCTT